MHDPRRGDLDSAQLEAADRRRPGRAPDLPDRLVQMFRRPEGDGLPLWEEKFPPLEDDLLDEEVAPTPGSPESRENETVMLLQVAAIIGVIAALCIVFGQ